MDSIAGNEEFIQRHNTQANSLENQKELEPETACRNPLEEQRIQLSWHTESPEAVEMAVTADRESSGR